MKITDVIVTPIAISDPPLLNAAGLHAPYALRIIIEIKSDANITGISELGGGSAILEALNRVKGLLIGANPFERTRIKQIIEEAYATTTEIPYVRYSARSVATRLYSAVNVALLDLIGKAVGRPVYDLLGGKVREQAEFSAYLFYKTEGAGGVFGFGRNPEASGWNKAKEEEALSPEQIVEQARAMCAEFGFKSIKLKGGVFEPRKEVATIEALSKAFGPKVPLRFDPNGIWSLETAITYCKQLAPYLEYCEDPCWGQDDMAALAQSVNIILATNMCTVSFEDLPTSIAKGSEHVILADHHLWGGLDAVIELGRICSVFGRGLSMHSNSHLGISLMAMVHLGCATEHLTYALDTHYPWQSEDVIVGGRIAFEDGAISPSKEPGLGVEIDQDALARLHQTYRACGITDRNDEIEMQKINPAWSFASHRF